MPTCTLATNQISNSSNKIFRTHGGRLVAEYAVTNFLSWQGWEFSPSRLIMADVSPSRPNLSSPFFDYFPWGSYQKTTTPLPSPPAETCVGLCWWNLVQIPTCSLWGKKYERLVSWLPFPTTVTGKFYKGLPVSAVLIKEQLYLGEASHNSTSSKDKTTRQTFKETVWYRLCLFHVQRFL